MTKRQLGQFFTTDTRVQRRMVSLVRHRTGSALEPSAGEGHLVRALLDARPGLDLSCVEYDKKLPWDLPVARYNAEFLSWSTGRDGTFDVIFGNPPYVAWKDALDSVRRSAKDSRQGWHGKVNVYHLFIERCVDLLAPGGELIFITPTDWLYQTATEALRAKVAAAGAITDIIHIGEERVFADADVPNLCVFRFQKGARRTKVKFRAGLNAPVESRALMMRSGRWFLLPAEVASEVSSWEPLSCQYDVKVGMVTGADSVFKVAPGTVERSVLRPMLTTTRKRQWFIDANHIEDFCDLPPLAKAHLLPHKDLLLARRIRNFDESNWWNWGAVRNAGAMAAPSERFFALAKTRSAEPFFTAGRKGARLFYTGGVLGLYRKDGALALPGALAASNSMLFRSVLASMLLVTGDKVQLQPSTLADALFPPQELERDALLWVPHDASA